MISAASFVFHKKNYRRMSIVNYFCDIIGYLLGKCRFVVWSAEPPSIVEAPPSVVKAAIGRTVTLTCRAFGAPTPLIVWFRGEVQSWSADHDRDNGSDTGHNQHRTVYNVTTLTMQVIIHGCWHVYSARPSLSSAWRPAFTQSGRHCLPLVVEFFPMRLRSW